MRRIAIVSDIHFAGPREQAHGPDFEFAHARPCFRTRLVRLYRHCIWMRNPVAHNSLLDEFIRRTDCADLVVANGDYTCDVAGVGVSHDEACESVQCCLGKLRARFGERFHAIIGDHELGKVALLGDHGGLRLRSWQRCTTECGLDPFWRVEMGNYVLLGITSTLVALPIFRPDAEDHEWADWEVLRAKHFSQIDDAFGSLQSGQKVILFCHDPTALTFLRQREAVGGRLDQIECTIIGHLHTRLVYWKSRLLAGMPILNGLGVTVRRMSTALNQARLWRDFKPRLCPALAGIELFKTGGHLTLQLDESARQPACVVYHRLPRRRNG